MLSSKGVEFLRVDNELPKRVLNHTILVLVLLHVSLRNWISGDRRSGPQLQLLVLSTMPQLSYFSRKKPQPTWYCIGYPLFLLHDRHKERLEKAGTPGQEGQGREKQKILINFKNFLDQRVKTCYLFGIEVWYVLVSKCRSY